MPNTPHRAFVVSRFLLNRPKETACLRPLPGIIRVRLFPQAHGEAVFYLDGFLGYLSYDVGKRPVPDRSQQGILSCFFLNYRSAPSVSHFRVENRILEPRVALAIARGNVLSPVTGNDWT